MPPQAWPVDYDPFAQIAQPNEFGLQNAPYVRSGVDYNTQLAPQEEQAFQGWLKQNNVPFDSSAPVTDYDMRGFYRGLMSGNPVAASAIDPNDKQLHYPDYWKTPLHQTFSNESQWATPDAPSWNDQDQLVDKNGRVIFDDRNTVPVAHDPFARGGAAFADTPGALPLTSQDQASRFVDKAGQVATSIADPFMNLATLAGRAAYGPESEGWGRYGPATPEDAAKGALLVTMPGLGRAAVAGGAAHELIGMGGAGEKIAAAAVKTPEGKIFTGTNHVEAAMRAEDAGHPIAGTMGDGFTTTMGRYVTRQEAQAIAESEGQIQNRRREQILPEDRALMSHQIFDENGNLYNPGGGSHAVPVEGDPFAGMGEAGERIAVVPRMQQAGAKYATENLSRLGQLEPKDLQQLIADAQSGKVVRHLSEKDGRQYKAGMIDVYQKALTDSIGGT